MIDSRILGPDELEAIARRVFTRRPVSSREADYRQAIADRRHLLGHIIAATRADLERAMGASRAEAVAQRQDWAAEAPDDPPSGYRSDWAAEAPDDTPPPFGCRSVP